MDRRQKHFDASHLNPLTQLAGALAYPVVRRLVLVSMLFILPFSLMQIALSLLARDALGWGADTGQHGLYGGGCVRHHRAGAAPADAAEATGRTRRGAAGPELRRGRHGVHGAAAASFPFSALMYFSVVLFATGEGIFNASLSAILSNAAPADAQGKVQGGAGAFSSLAQVVGPLGGGQLYSRLGVTPTFGIGAGLIAVALGLLGAQKPAA